MFKHYVKKFFFGAIYTENIPSIVYGYKCHLKLLESRNNYLTKNVFLRTLEVAHGTRGLVVMQFQYQWFKIRRALWEPGGTRWRTAGELKRKLANGVVSQYSHATSERGLSSITQADGHTSAVSIRLTWRPHRFKLNRPFRGKTKSGFCACAITFRTSYTHNFDFRFYQGADKSLARPTSRYILFDGENISFDASLVIYIYIYIYI